MNELLNIHIFHSHLFGLFSISNQALAIGLWAGLALLMLLLIVLMLTRWGQANALSKCVALSIFAHLLLMGYAYGTILFFEEPPGTEEGEGATFKLSSIDSEDTSDSPSDSNEPWNQFVAESAPAPVVPSPQVATLPFESAVSREAFAPEPVANEIPAVQTPLAIAGERPESAAMPGANPLRPQTSDVKPSEINTPIAKRDEKAAPTMFPGAPKPSMKRPDFAPERIAHDTKPKRSNRPQEEPGDIEALNAVAHTPKPAEHKAADADSVGTGDIAINKATDSGAPEGTRNDSLHSEDFAVAELKVVRNTNPLGRPDDNDMPAFGSPLRVALKRRLGDGDQVPSLYSYRLADSRVDTARIFGGDPSTEAAVKASLKWLAANQHKDGHWDASDHGGGIDREIDGHSRGGAGTDADTGITGLALLAFLAAGNSHLEGEYRVEVQKGLEYLLRSQKPNGDLAGNARMFARMYCQGMASLALSEAFAMTGDYRLRPAVQRAVNYAVKSQHPTSGGWRYAPGDRGDMSQFGWQVMALRSAELGGVEVPAGTKVLMRRFLESCCSGDHKGLGSYRENDKTSRTMTAEALTCRYFMELEPSPALVKEAGDHIAGDLPRPGVANLYYWYYGSLAAFQTQGLHWRKWNTALKRELTTRQETRGALAGSWSPETRWGGYGGRVYSTAMCTLCLEVYYRYLPIYGGRLALSEGVMIR